MDNSQDENKLTNKLQQDIIKIEGEKIFLNPFFYCVRLDKETNKWLKDLGQIKQSKIIQNRNRFYPELEWENLSHKEKLIKDSTIEMLLKTLDIIITFHPQLNAKQFFLVERKLILSKKLVLEKWVNKFFDKRAKLLLNEKRKLNREKIYNSWKNWFYIKQTQKALYPIFVIILIAALLGWIAGVSNNSCNPYFESTLNNQI